MEETKINTSYDAEVVKDILAAIVSRPNTELKDAHIPEQVALAIKYAEEVHKQLGLNEPILKIGEPVESVEESMERINKILDLDF